MTAAQALDLAGEMLQEPKILERTEDDPVLLGLLDAVISEICAEYFPLRTSEEAESGGEIPLSSLAKRFRQLFSAEIGGKRVACALLPFSLRTPAGKVKLEYAYLPAPLQEESEQLELSPEVDLRTVALGVAAEYSLRQSLYEQALAFDRKFRESLAALAPRRAGSLPARRFV